MAQLGIQGHEVIPVLLDYKVIPVLLDYKVIPVLLAWKAQLVLKGNRVLGEKGEQEKLVQMVQQVLKVNQV